MRPTLLTADLDYTLPAAAIATTPANPRDSAKLMVCRNSPAAAVEHTQISDLCRFFETGDLLVLNNTRVLPHRFVGHRADTGAKAEGLILGPSTDDHAGAFTAMIRTRRQKPGVEIALHGHDGGESGLRLRLHDRVSANSAAWVVTLMDENGNSLAFDAQSLERFGLTPLPPYILTARRDRGESWHDEVDRTGYQTVFAETAGGLHGSIAAPTAGLHFTPALLSRLLAVGVRTTTVALQVGLGTFKPVEAERIDDHPMHSEWCRVPAHTALAIAETRASGKRVVAVGTTAARTLESFESTHDMLGRGEPGIDTRILITPGYRFRHVDALLTNFHLPRSTLMAMVAAMLEQGEPASAPRPSGVARLLLLYQEALAQGYRFYSFGDAMLILP